MLQTLLKIGEWQSQGKSKWDRFLDYPKVQTKDRYGNPIKNYTLPIIFDLDESEVVIDQYNLKEYADEDVKSSLAIKLKGSNSKKISTAGPVGRLEQLYISFFGKPSEDNEQGNLFDALEMDYSELLNKSIKGFLRDIFHLEEIFRKKTEFTNNKGNKSIDIKEVERVFKMAKNEKIVFLLCKIKSAKYGFEKPTLFSEIPQYKTFLERLYFSEDKKAAGSEVKKLCYASGEKMEDVKPFNLDERYSFNKMFVTTTQNYASLFSVDNFEKNYQASLKNQEYLDVGSKYLLNNGYVVRIANIEHLILPEFLTNSKLDLDLALESINRKSDVLFGKSLKKIEFFVKTIKDELNDQEPFWINFIAFDPGGRKYFKSTEVIKDVSNFYFQKLLALFSELDRQFESFSFLNWNEIMTIKVEGEFVRPSYNFSTLYKLIPIKEKTGRNFILKNKALLLFKSILENRKIEKNQLYNYFTELILCHYYRRYDSYTNVEWYSEKSFYFAVRDSTFKYLAFFQLLKKLKLTDMEEPINTENSVNQYDQLENDFFQQMNLKQEQKAMFYLGRLLNSVEYIQKQKQIKKTVIQKVNFNGLEIDSIRRLRSDLMEKARQHGAVGKIIFTDKKFSQHFDHNDWIMNPQEALFFLLTGYSFSAKTSDDNLDKDENE